jgi:hypothetical protein
MSPSEMLILENQVAIMKVLRDMAGYERDAPTLISKQIGRTENQLCQHIYIPPEHENFTSNNDLLTK